MKRPVNDTRPLVPDSPDAERQQAGRTPRHPIRTSLAMVALSALIVLLGAESAAARDEHGFVDTSRGDVRAATSLPAAAAAPPPSPAATPAPATTTTPTPTPTPPPTRTPHEQQNGEQPVQRDDLGFLGFLFVGGVGFILASGAVGILLSGRARRRRDRMASSREDVSG